MNLFVIVRFEIYFHYSSILLISIMVQSHSFHNFKINEKLLPPLCWVELFKWNIPFHFAVSSLIKSFPLCYAWLDLFQLKNLSAFPYVLCTGLFNENWFLRVHSSYADIRKFDWRIFLDFFWETLMWRIVFSIGGTCYVARIITTAMQFEC